MSRKTPSPLARFKIIDDVNGKNTDLATKLETCYKFLIYLKEPSQILIDERALKAIEFIKNQRDTKLNEKIFEQNIEIAQIYSNILQHYYNDFKAYVSNYDVLKVGGKAEGVEKIYISQFLFLFQLVPVLWNATNKFAFFRYKFHESGGTKALLTYFSDIELVRKCIRFKYSIESKTDTAPGLYVIRAFIGTFNNLSKIADEIQNDLTELNATSILINLGEEVKDYFSHRLSTYMAIANIMRDKEIESMSQTKQVIKDLIDLIKTGASDINSKQTSRQKVDIYGSIQNICVIVTNGSSYHLVELIEALYRIAVNDSIKAEIYENIKDSILKISLNGNNVEREYAIKLLWQLCFDEIIVQKVIDNSEMLSLIEKLNKENDSKNLKNYCEGVLWSVKKLQEKNETPKIVSGSTENESVHAAPSSHNSSTKRHVMISYNRESRDLCLKIKKELEAAGHKVWIDIDDIHGSSLESMANAIEHSQCILICMTEKYKQSPNCRAVSYLFYLSFFIIKALFCNNLKEAEYAFRMNAPIIPLIMQKDYMPDGWLGLILGSKIFVHFMKYSFEVCMKKLFDEVSSLTGSEKAFVKIESVTRTSAVKITEPTDNNDDNNNRVDASKWSKEQVSEWAERINISQGFNKVVEQFDGRLLAQFYKIKKDAPEFFFTNLKEDHKLNLVQLVKLTAELDDLFKDFIY